AFTRQNRKNLATGAYATRLSAGLERTVDLLIALGTALVLWFGARFVLHGAMTPGDLIVFLAYVKNAFRPVKDAAKYTGRLARASCSGCTTPPRGACWSTRATCASTRSRRSARK